MRSLLALLSSMLLTSTAFAEGINGAQGSGLNSILMLVGFFAVFYFLLIRPQMKRNKDQRKMISEIIKGDEILTTGGMIGKVVNVGDNYTELEVADNIIVKVQKNAVSGVLPKGSVKTN